MATERDWIPLGVLIDSSAEAGGTELGSNGRRIVELLPRIPG